MTFSCCFNFSVRAQDQYDLGIRQNDEFVWEVKELNEYDFGKVFGAEPNFELGDRIRIVIRQIAHPSLRWQITIDFWDYKEDWGQPGASDTIEVWENPIQYDDNIFIPVPVGPYLEEAEDTLPSEYYVEGNTIFMRGTSASTGRDFLWEKIYNTNGVPQAEIYYSGHEANEQLMIVKVESTIPLIPVGFYFIGFILLSITAIIFIGLRRKKLRIIS